MKSRKKPKSAFKSNADEDESHDLQEQNLSSEDDDFNASQKLNAGTSSILNQNDSPDLKLKGKSRCNGGSASDPQGVYAKVCLLIAFPKNTIAINFKSLNFCPKYCDFELLED